jgi:integrase
MSESYVRAMLARMGKRAGIDRRVHAHALRHTFAVELSREGVPIPTISRALGHSSSAVTSRYIDHLEPRELLETIASRPRWER